MSIYDIKSITEAVGATAYPGRGIITGATPDGAKAVCAYFIMGRSANSRNRIFTELDGAVFTRPFDESKVEDPSLIIYAAVRKYKNLLIVTNGDQTDTIYNGLASGLSLSESLQSRSFEPDAPNFTPRISSVLRFADGSFSYEMSILKSIDAAGTGCARYTFSYPQIPGLGHFIHTYAGPGSPLPAFQGEPERVEICGDIDEFTGTVWSALNEENKISLYVRYTDMATGEYESRLINKYNKGNGNEGI